MSGNQAMEEVSRIMESGRVTHIVNPEVPSPRVQINDPQYISVKSSNVRQRGREFNDSDPCSKRVCAPPLGPMFDYAELPQESTNWIKARGGKGGNDCIPFKTTNYCRRGSKCRAFHYINSKLGLSDNLRKEYRQKYIPSSPQCLEKFIHVWEKTSASKQVYYTAGYRNQNFIVLAQSGSGMKQRDGSLWWYATRNDARNAVHECLRNLIFMDT